MGDIANAEADITETIEHSYNMGANFHFQTKWQIVFSQNFLGI